MKTLASAALGLSVAFSGFAQADTMASPAAPHVARSCFWKRDISGFAAHDDQHLYLRVGVRRVYELKLFANCLQLSWVHRVGLQTFGDSDICEGVNPGVDVIVHDIGFHMRCPVTGIRQLSPPEIAALPKDAQP